MIGTARQATWTEYASELHPEVKTEDSEIAKVLAWADENPKVWKIVGRGSRSKAFGPQSCHYIGWAQGSNSPDAILQRLLDFHQEVVGEGWGGPGSIFHFAAMFTFEHYGEKGFRGGDFQTWRNGGKTPHNCETLDYTPETLEAVLDRFDEWAGPGLPITIDGREARGDR